LEAAVDEAAANVKVAGLFANPAFSYNREEVFLDGRAFPENYMQAELSLDISGRRGLRVEGEKLGLQAARASSTRSRASLLIHALDVYWAAARARQNVRILQAERDSFGRVVEAVRSRASAGETSGYDLGRLELEVASVEDLVAEADRDLDAWQRRLAFLTGMPDTRLDAGEALSLPEDPGPVEPLLEQALEARMDYQAARLQAAQAEREISAAGRGWVPTLVLSGGAKSVRVEERTAWGYLAGLSLGVPLFDHGQGESARAHARLKQSKAVQRSIEAQVRSEVLTTHGALVRSRAQAERFDRVQLPRVDQLVRRAEISYREGERPVFELLDAYRTTRAIRLRQIELKEKARLAENGLARATGQIPGGAK
jgi:cobalt-zinc-cadmium efflux system outer membrane protein